MLTAGCCQILRLIGQTDQQSEYSQVHIYIGSILAGYHQVPMETEATKKTVFVTPFDQSEFQRDAVWTAGYYEGRITKAEGMVTGIYIDNKHIAVLAVMLKRFQGLGHGQTENALLGPSGK